VVIDSCQLGGDFAELLIVDGFPMLAYFGGTADELCIARADTITGSNANDWSTESVDASFEEGLAVSMAKIAGAPAIAYIVEEDAPYVNRKLKYTWWYH